MIVDFEYDGERLSEYGLIIASVDGSSSANTLEWGNQLEFNTIKNKMSGVNYATSVGYSDVYSVTFQVIKHSCNSSDADHISDTEIRQIEKWLNRKLYKRFSPISDNGEFSGYHFYGSFNINPIVIASDIIGLELTFTSNAPYAFGDTVTYSVNASSFELYCLSDEIGECQIKMIITTSQAGDLTINNNLIGNTVIKNCVANEQITIDSENLVITSNQAHPRLYNDFNYKYPRLLNGYPSQINKFTLSMQCKVYIEYKPIRKIGAVL